MESSKEEKDFIRRYNEAVDYLEMQEKIMVTYNYMFLDHFRDKLSKSEMQFIIDIADAIKEYSKADKKVKVKVRKKYNFNQRRCEN